MGHDRPAGPDGGGWLQGWRNKEPGVPYARTPLWRMDRGQA